MFWYGKNWWVRPTSDDRILLQVEGGDDRETFFQERISIPIAEAERLLKGVAEAIRVTKMASERIKTCSPDTPYHTIFMDDYREIDVESEPE